MLTQLERQRFAILQEKKENNTLNDAEQREWREFVTQIEAAEAMCLRPATERIVLENAAIEAQNRALKALLQSKARVARRLERV